MREDFLRLLFKLAELKENKANEHKIRIQWYKFLSNIMKHHALKDKMFTPGYIYKNISSFPKIQETWKFEIRKPDSKSNKQYYIDNFNDLIIEPFYTEYIKGIASVSYNSKK